MQARVFVALLFLSSCAVARGDVYQFTFSAINGSQCAASGDVGPDCIATTLVDLTYDLTAGPTSYNSYAADYLDAYNEDLSIGATGLGINFDITQTGGFFNGPLYGYSVDVSPNVIAQGPWANPTVLPGTYLGGYAYLYDSTVFYDTEAVLTIADVSSATVAPEPGTWALVMSGAGVGVGVFQRRLRRPA